MVAEDFELVRKIFELVESGVVRGYDSFCYKVEVGPGCMGAELAVERDGVEFNDDETDFDSFAVYDLVKQLKDNAVRRGEGWVSFAMSYTRGGEVKTNFKY
ncbi:hypothetical protein ACYZT8_07370 [Pseudomonas sp. LB3P93]|jgi:hypothetical protein